MKNGNRAGGPRLRAAPSPGGAHRAWAAAAALLSLGAGAQEAALQAADASAAGTQTAAADSGQLAEIVVTATKRKEELSKVPISIVAYGREALEASGVKSLEGLAALTPGVEFDNSAGFGPGTLTNIAIRGINSTIGTSTTGIYLDDTPIQTRVTALSYFGNPLPLMFDVERVEVDRGPQGTLFGAGAEGGALRFISPDPGLEKTSGFARTELAFTSGGSPSYEAGAAVGGPIESGKFGYRVSAWARRDGGYVDRVDPFSGAAVQSDANWTGSYALRAAVAAAPSAGLRITPSVYAQSVHINDSSAFFEGLGNPAAGVFDSGRLLAQPSTDKFLLPSLKIESAQGAVTLTSVTSYFYRNGQLNDDLTSLDGALLGGYGSPLGPAYPTSHGDAGPGLLATFVHAFSQEIRVASSDPADPLQWTAGVFYSDQKQDETEAVFSPYFAVNLFGLPGDTSLLTSSLLSHDRQTAAFGQADYALSARWKLTLGVRVARTSGSFDQVQNGALLGLTSPTESTGTQSETPVTPKLGLSYQLDTNNLLYTSVSKGYRVGGANPPIPLASAADPAGCPLGSEPAPYRSDSVWSYEAGAKDKLAGGKLVLDSSVFHVNWSDIQQQIYLSSCGFGYIANTGAAVSNGFDVGMRAAATSSLTLGLSFALTNAYVTKNVSAAGLTLVQAGDVVSSPPAVGSPRNLTASAEYALSVLGRDAYLRAEDIFHSRNTGPFNTMIPGSAGYAPLIPANPATNLVNARAGVDLQGVDLSLFANNLFNSHPLLGRYQDTVTSLLFTDTTLRPRTVGVTASYRF
jgi:outer membrane receptor protein involved in Fe transport